MSRRVGVGVLAVVLFLGGDALTRATGAPAAGVGAGGNTRLLLWPAGAPEFTYPSGGSGRTVIVADLQTGRHSVHQLPHIAPGDFPVPLLALGDRLVYNGDGGVSVVASTLRGGVRVLGRAIYFVPSARADQVLLVRTEGPRANAIHVQPVSVSSGHRGRGVVLPRGAGIVQGTARGLLLTSQSGTLELWRPGRTARTLDHLGTMRADAGFASSTRFVAYGVGCRIEEATSGFPRTPVGYDVCRTLRVIDLVTGKRVSYPAPAGTLGWVPNGFGANNGFAPKTGALAAEAAVPPARKGRIRLFVVQPPDRRRAPIRMPSSAARLYARTAWSPDGSWLLYQGPRQRLRMYQTATGIQHQSALTCCEYTAMIAIAGSR